MAKVNRRSFIFIAVGAVIIFVGVFSLLPSGGAKRHGARSGSLASNAIPLDPSGEFFHIAVLAPLSGDSAAAGRSVQLGASAAVHALNEGGGLLGKKIQLSILDTGSSVQETISVAEQVVAENATAKFSLIIDGSDDEIAPFVIQVIRDKKIPYIAVAGGHCKTSIDGKTVKENLWGTGLTLQASVEPLLIHLADKLRAPEKDFRISYLTGESDYLREITKFIRGTAESLSFQTVDDSYYDTRITDYYTVIRDVLAKSPEVLIVNNPGEAGAAFLEQSHKLGLEKEMAIAGFGTFDAEQPAIIGQSVEGATTVSTYAEGIETPENATFILRMHQVGLKQGEQPTALALSAYNALNIAAKAFQKAGDPSLEKFSVAMEDLEINLPTANGFMSKGNHMLVQPFYAVKINKGQRTVAEFLGDAAHPHLDGCKVELSEN